MKPVIDWMLSAMSYLGNLLTFYNFSLSLCVRWGGGGGGSYLGSLHKLIAAMFKGSFLYIRLSSSIRKYLMG